MTRGITDNSVVYISIFSNSQLMSVINNNNNVPIFTTIFVWVGILSSLFSMASDDFYLHGLGGTDLYLVSGCLMASLMSSNYIKRKSTSIGL